MKIVATRTDYAISSTASAYGYDALGHLIDATSPSVTGSAHATFGWRLDGLLANRGYSTGATTLVYAYDGAKRAIAECNGSGGTCSGAQIDIERTYDRVGDVMSETQTISGATPIPTAPSPLHTTPCGGSRQAPLARSPSRTRTMPTRTA